MRVILIGGTSNTGKSTLAEALATRLGLAYGSTDQLARHPGRPWRTPDREVPPHVAEHYASLGVDELIGSVLDHYERLWPRIEELVADGGLVLEGSALWPTRVAALEVPAVWLTADDDLLRRRIRTAGCYDAATPQERHLMDQFLARTLRYQELMRAETHRLALPTVHVRADASVADLADEVLARVKHY